MTNGNGVGSDPHGPLAKMWRDVYAKAAGVAEGRTTDLVKDHVYRYHPNGAGGGGGGGEGPFVDEAGDTMTGTLFFQGDTIPLEGSIIISGTGVVATGARLLGPTSPTFTPGADGSPYDRSLGIRFSLTVDEYLGEIRFYRQATTQVSPAAFQLWAGSAPAPLWSTSSIVDDGAVGWQATPIPTPSRPALSAGTIYTLSFVCPAGNAVASQGGYVPVPESPFVWRGGAQVVPGTGYPWMDDDRYFGLDVALGGGPVTLEPAHTGAIRLPAGARICWRKADNTADWCLGFDAAGNLLVAGEPVGHTLTTSTTAPAGALDTMWFNPSETA